MKLKTSLAAALCAAGLLSGVGSAQAGITLNDWRIDLGAIGGDFAGMGVFGPPPPVGSLGITQLTYLGLNFATTTLDVGPAGLSVGDRTTIDLLGVATGASGNAGVINTTSTGAVLNTNFEITFENTTTLEITTITPIPGGAFVTNRHLDAGTGPDGFATNGVLNIYVDAIGIGAGVTANADFNTGGAGMDDGFLLASFVVQGSVADTGSFLTSSLDGADDATFVMTYNSGYVLDGSGNPLVIGSTIGLVDANTDADPDSNGAFDTAPTNFASPLGACPATGTPESNCGSEDGSFVLQVPEPGTLALLGISMLGLGLMRRGSKSA